MRIKTASQEATIRTASQHEPASPLPPHVEETVRSTARLHGEHHQATSSLQRAITSMTSLLGRPKFIAMLSACFAAWLVLNLGLLALGRAAIDPPPFPWLADVASMLSLYLVVFVLATQQRDDELSQHRDQLTLGLAILSDQKTARIIQLLEELRRDNPLVRDRVDEEIEAMIQPVDAQSFSTAIRESHAEAEQQASSGGAE